MKKLVIGILAHVDAGKTTLSEGMLYLTGQIKKLGRVDHRNAFLDTHELERERGITIFSKQALFETESCSVTLLDTPGHADFSAEAERAVQVLDYAVMVISGTDGIQAHTETLWRLLGRYNVPAFIFVTKMDVSSRDKDGLMDELRSRFGGQCVDFTGSDWEELALCGDEALEEYSAAGAVTDGTIARLTAQRALFPCFFGSGLKLDGVDALIDGVDRYTVQPDYPAAFAARVFKIARDEKGGRLTFLKITGGVLRVRDTLRCIGRDGVEAEEKISQLRLYSGAKYTAAETVSAGAVCAAAGLTATFPGQGLGAEAGDVIPVLEPVLRYRILPPADCDPLTLLPKLRQLEEEDPLLRIVWDARSREIGVQLMGTVQTEILRRLVKERFDLDVTVDAGRILYRETIAAPVEGVGHFEPLRHYAEVHLLLTPLPGGSGVQLAADCPEGVLDRSWQRLILTHLAEKQHRGVLTGAPLTDVRITLIAGRAHPKHTEGGDFREAACRAVRQGLMRAESLLLEPWYAFRLEVPPAELGRAISDIRAMNGTFSSPEDAGELTALSGRAPVAALRDYAAAVAAYTHGRGKFFCRPDGYEVCADAAAVVGAANYAPEADLENTPDSVFCAHGAGFPVKWDRVREYMHLDTGLDRDRTAAEPPLLRARSLDIDEKELEAIMDREFGPIRRPMYSARQYNAAAESAERQAPAKKEYLLVDGYNVIFAWPSLSIIAQDNLDLARRQLADILANYRGYTKCELVLVFDAYRVPGGEGSREDYHGIHVAYTKMGETGDAYIEKLADDIGKNYAVRAVTSDALVQLSAFRSGILRTGAREFENEVAWVLARIDEALGQLDGSMRGEKIGDKVNFNGKQQ